MEAGITQSESVMALRAGGYDSPYLIRELDSANESTKAACRERVAEFILKHHDAGNLRMFSLPSLHWRFEHLIDASHKAKCQFIGVERDIGIVRNSAPWIPGERASFFDRQFKSMKFWGLRTDRSWLIHADAQTFLRLGQPDILTAAERSTWNCYRAWSAIWLDFTSQLSAPLELALPKLGAGCDLDCPSVPVAITFMKGRETAQVSETMGGLGFDREDYITYLLSRSRHRTFETLDGFEYASVNGCRMITIMGRLVRREQMIVDPMSPHNLRKMAKAKATGKAPHERPLPRLDPRRTAAVRRDHRCGDCGVPL